MTESGSSEAPGSPSERIAAELRRRIAVGELAPGARVPSTRRITQEWGVAMATATKVLNRLREEGLVRAVPGVGTVVAGQARRPAAAPKRKPAPADAVKAEAAARRGGGDGELGPDRIVLAAIRLADTEGLAALSMRRIATELDVATMSLYRHVPSKDELLRLMTGVCFAEQPLPAPPPPGQWREGLEAVARLQWAIYRRHPWLASTMSFTRPTLVADAALHTERSLAVLAGLGLSGEEMAQAAVTLAAFACGLAVHFEREVQAEQDSGMSADEWMDGRHGGEDHTELMTDTERFPMFESLHRGPEIDMSLNALFEFGLVRMLDGIGALVGNRGGADG
ncbi:TetR/AcrR family transcriptional regulator C-terminal domain-containing protein [Kitasatospora sp. NPDC051170]|uniref:TetR/AcrR family transcriptional regulator C-terminal domain-containing protein n=1 Tax=Kitasatospora sp. NPDC051170 TaxID=3364056 RepID=UPI0037A9AA40